MNRTPIDLNADLGEEVTDDDALLAVVTSANVACGFHAGTDATMRRVCAEAARLGVAVGAQVSYDDRAHFGRRHLDVPADRLLVFRASEGWEPLCRFLGKPVPATGYPRTNTMDDFVNRFRQAGWRVLFFVRFFREVMVRKQPFRLNQSQGQRAIGHKAGPFFRLVHRDHPPVASVNVNIWAPGDGSCGIRKAPKGVER